MWRVAKGFPRKCEKKDRLFGKVKIKTASEIHYEWLCPYCDFKAKNWYKAQDHFCEGWQKAIEQTVQHVEMHHGLGDY